MARLGALRQLDLDHFDLRVGGDGGERFRREPALAVATSKIA